MDTALPMLSVAKLVAKMLRDTLERSSRLLGHNGALPCANYHVREMFLQLELYDLRKMQWWQ